MSDLATLLSVDPQELRAEEERLKSWSGLPTISGGEPTRLERAAQDRRERLDAFERERDERIRAAEQRRLQEREAQEARRLARARAQLDAVEDLEAIRARILRRRAARYRATLAWFVALVLLPWIGGTAYLREYAPRFYAAELVLETSPDDPVTGLQAAYRLKADLQQPSVRDAALRAAGIAPGASPPMLHDWLTATVDANRGVVVLTTLGPGPEAAAAMAQAASRQIARGAGPATDIARPTAITNPVLPDVFGSSALMLVILLGGFLSFSLLRAGLAHHSNPL